MERKFADGQRVGLVANAAEGFDFELGTVLEYEPSFDMYVVELDRQFRSGRGDDGLREVSPEQLEPVPS